MHGLKDMVAMLMCDDVQESIRFYTQVLGFTVTYRMDDVGKSGWASVNHGRIQLMLASPDYIVPPLKNQGRYSQAMYYFYPEDIQQLYNAVRDAGIETTELTDRFYGMREFEMLDPSGHVLVFGQEIPGRRGGVLNALADFSPVTPKALYSTAHGNRKERQRVEGHPGRRCLPSRGLRCWWLGFHPGWRLARLGSQPLHWAVEYNSFGVGPPRRSVCPRLHVEQLGAP